MKHAEVSNMINLFELYVQKDSMLYELALLPSFLAHAETEADAKWIANRMQVLKEREPEINKKIKEAKKTLESMEDRKCKVSTKEN